MLSYDMLVYIQHNSLINLYSMAQVEYLLEKAGFLKESQKEEQCPAQNLWKIYKHDIR